MDLGHIFKYHKPTPKQTQSYEELRLAAWDFAAVVKNLTPKGADQAAVIRKIREAVMTANAAIALDGRLYPEGD